MTETTTSPTISMIYVFDAYCGWCFGFGPQLAKFLDSAEDDYRLEVISGGLFAGDRRMPASAIPYVEESNRRISEATGAGFGAAYRALMADGEFVMDSTAAARGFAALRAQDPERAVVIANAMQDEFYRNGRSLSAPQTYAHLARRLRLDADEVVGAYTSVEVDEAAKADFAVSRTLGVVEFPTLLVRMPDHRLGRLGDARSTAADLAGQMAAYRAAFAGSIAPSL